MAERLVLEWTRTSLRVALAQGKDPKWKLKALYALPIPHGPDRAAEVRDFLKKNKLTGNKQVIGVIEREHVITRTVRFPSTDAKELKRMVDLYARAQLPYAHEDTVMDYYVLDQYEDFSTVTVVACQRQIIDHQVSMFNELGLNVERLTVSSWGVSGWYQSVARQQEFEEPALVVNVDEHRTDLVLVARGYVLSSRSLGQGKMDWDNNDNPAELLTLEIERSRTAVRKEFPGIEVNAILLTGIGPLDDWQAHIHERLGISVVRTQPLAPYNPKAKCQLEHDASVVVSAGLANCDLRQAISLSPKEIKEKVQHRRQSQDLALVASLTAVAFVLGIAILGFRVQTRGQHLSQLDQAIERMTPQARELRNMRKQSRMIRQLVGERYELTNLIGTIFQATPGSVNLEALDYQRKRHQISIRGHAPTTQAVLGFISALETLERVADVRLKYSTQRRTTQGELIDFELSVTPIGKESES